VESHVPHVIWSAGIALFTNEQSRRGPHDSIIECPPIHSPR
jgi:hypothetical protein